MTNETINLIKDILKEGYALIGVGSRVKGDDGFGSLFADELLNIDPNRFFDASTAPENYAFKAAKTPYKNIVIIDACYFSDGQPGEIRLFMPDQLASTPFPSTHGPTLSMTVDFISQYGKKVWVIGVMPKTTNIKDFTKEQFDGETLSPELQKSFDELLKLFKEVENA